MSEFAKIQIVNQWYFSRKASIMTISLKELVRIIVRMHKEKSMMREFDRRKRRYL